MRRALQSVAGLVGTTPVKIACASAIAAAATDGLIATHPVALASKEGGSVRAVSGDDIAWDSRASGPCELDGTAIVGRVCVPIFIAGVAAMLSSVLVVELLVLNFGGADAMPNILSPQTVSGLARACRFSSVWFGAISLWIFANAKRYSATKSLPRPTRSRIRFVALAGWFASAWTLWCHLEA